MTTRPSSFNLVTDLTPLPWAVLKDVALRLGWEEGKNIEPYLKKIKGMSAYEVFDAYLEYNGIINWTSNIITAWESIKVGAGYGKPQL